MGDVLKKFGRYFLLDQVAQGGMAEIYRARLATPGDAGRLLVIKKIQAGYGSNPEFVAMFRSEIKVTMGFNHPNIVQLYDFGEERQQPFIAMEYVDGKNLRQFISRFGEMRQFFPVELAAYIVEQAACGLYYAHSFKDKITGQPLNIVHRDISPQNVLIAYEGTVKVIDFGIAKAATNSESTRAGVIKGKPSYLSPEQITGEVLDGRSDIFSLGTVLWELLVGKKLFAGENDLAVLKLIESCQTHVKPPSTINPKIPKELDYIVLKALAKNREKRYQTAEELQRALHKFLYAFAPDFNPSDLSYCAKDLFKDQIVEDRKRIQRLNDEVEKLLAIDNRPLELSNKGDASGEKTQGEGTGVTGTLPSGARDVFGESKPGPKLEVEAKPTAVPRARENRPAPASSSSGNRPSTRPAPVRAYSQASSGRAYSGAPAQHRDLKRKNQGHLGKLLGALVAAGVVAVFYSPQLLLPVRGIIRDCDSYSWPWCEVKPRGPAGAESPPAPAVSNSVRLRLDIAPPGGRPRIMVNGKTLASEQTTLSVKLDSNINVVVERPGYRISQSEFTVRALDVGPAGDYTYPVNLVPEHYGYLGIRTTVSMDAEIYIDGKDSKPWVVKTPFQELKLPVGTYSVLLNHPILGVHQWLEVNIKENRLDPPLEPKLDIRAGSGDAAAAPQEPARRVPASNNRRK